MRKVRQLNDVEDDGFYLCDTPQQALGDDIAFLSLRIALHSYFSTYRSIRHSLTNLIAEQPDPEFRASQSYSLDYMQHAAESILHFQHFAELVCRTLLRSEHILLVADTGREHVLLHRLLEGEALGSIDETKLNWANFSSILHTIAALTKAGRLENERFGFLMAHLPALRTLNDLRNRLWHRGAFILHYRALDEFIGMYILPFALDVQKHSDFKGRNVGSRLPLACGIEPVDEIAASFRNGNKFDPNRVALLKELGRAAYENPLRWDNVWFQEENRQIRKLAEKRVEAESRGAKAGVLSCPVCGVEALVGLMDWSEHHDDVSGETVAGEPYIFEVDCKCCSFSLWGSVGSPENHGVHLPNYWDVETWE